MILNPDRAYTTAELARASGASYASTHREVQRLLAFGLLTGQQIGQAIRLSADQAHPAYAPIAELLRLSYGPAVVIPRVLAGVTGITDAYIYGSWAARRAGEAGDAPGDIDVLVIGSPARAAIHNAASVAERSLGREVNINIISAEAWKSGDSLFLRTVKERPRLQLELEES